MSRVIVHVELDKGGLGDVLEALANLGVRSIAYEFQTEVERYKQNGSKKTVKKNGSMSEAILAAVTAGGKVDIRLLREVLKDMGLNMGNFSSNLNRLKDKGLIKISGNIVEKIR